MEKIDSHLYQSVHHEVSVDEDLLYSSLIFRFIELTLVQKQAYFSNAA